MVSSTSVAPPATVPALPPMGPALLLRILLKRGQRPLPGQDWAASAPLESRFALAGLDHAAIARYGAALGFAPGAVPLTWWYLPVQRAHMATLLGRAFPFRLAGIVHVDHAMTAHAPVPTGLPLLLSTRVTILPPRPSGAIYCALETQVSCAGLLVVSCNSTYLAQRGQRSGAPRAAAAPLAPTTAAGSAGIALGSWRLAPSSGRAYARLSGDYNPIHLTRATARLFGLDAPIIHGMHSVARACALLEGSGLERITTISAAFRRPLPLGASVSLVSGAAPGSYQAYSGGACVFDGAYARASAGSAGQASTHDFSLISKKEQHASSSKSPQP